MLNRDANSPVPLNTFQLGTPQIHLLQDGSSIENESGTTQTLLGDTSELAPYLL